MHANNDFQFASIDLTKKTDKITSISSYKDTLFENFQELKKAMKIKMTRLINQSFENQASRTHANKTKTSKLANAKKTDESTRTNQTIRKIQFSDNSRLNNMFNTNSSSST